MSSVNSNYDYPINLLNELADGEWDLDIPEDVCGTIDYLLSRLSERQRSVIRMHFVDSLTYEEIGKVFNVTRERVRQIEAKTLRLLQHPSRLNYIKIGIAGYITQVRTQAAENAVSEQMRQMLETMKIAADRLSKITGDASIAKLEETALDTRRSYTLESLDLSVRAYTCLKRAGAETVGDILKLDLSKIRNLGDKSQAEVLRKINSLGLKMEAYSE